MTYGPGYVSPAFAGPSSFNPVGFGFGGYSYGGYPYYGYYGYLPGPYEGFPGMLRAAVRSMDKSLTTHMPRRGYGVGCHGGRASAIMPPAIRSGLPHVAACLSTLCAPVESHAGQLLLLGLGLPAGGTGVPTARCWVPRPSSMAKVKSSSTVTRATLLTK